jgi:hypothetical protein
MSHQCLACLFLCICLYFESIFHMLEKTCGLYLSEPGLFHLTCYSPIASIYLQTHSFILPYDWIKLHYVYHIFLIHSSVVGHLGCSYSLAIVNSVAINIGMQASLLYPDLHFFKCMPRSGTTGSLGSSIFSFWRTYILCM